MRLGRLLIFVLLGWLGTSRPLLAQEPLAPRELELRVLRVLDPGSVLIDRGGRDGLEVGDPVMLYPREGGSLQGTVRSVEPRFSRVELFERAARPAVGTRGVVSVPTERFVPEPQAPAPQLPEHPPWENPDTEYTPGQPLLAEVAVLHPEDRATRSGGRWYLSTNHVFYEDELLGEDREDHFTRLGFDVFYENPFGKGGVLNFDAELNQREASLPDFDGEDNTLGRLDRLSYSWGGTRFEPVRQEVGRFLQTGLPEFGLIDGYEVSWRRDDGDRISASVGWLPEPDQDQTSFDDFQVAGSYRWVADESERVSVAAGFQKTWHDGQADRDLFVADARVLRSGDWTYRGTAWIDFYRGDDDPKDEGLELTRVRASATRPTEDGGTERWSYLHSEIPFFEREAFTEPVARQLADSRNDRLAWDRWIRWNAQTSFFVETGAWVDDQESGGDLELGMELAELAEHEGELRVSGFFTRGEFSDALGGRLGYGFDSGTGRWNASYELARRRSLGFAGADFAETVQQTLSLSHDLFLDDRWDLRLSADLRRFEEQDSYALGAYLQRRF